MEMLHRQRNCTAHILHYYRTLKQGYQGNISGHYGNSSLDNTTLWDFHDIKDLEWVCESNRFRIGVQATSLGVIIFCSLIFNLLVLFVFYHRPSLLTISNRFVLNLAVSNLLITVLVMPFVFTSTLMGPGWDVSPVGCRVIAVATTLLFAACIYTLLLISVDRMYAIKRPLHYSMKITRVRSSVYIFLVWLVSFLVALPPLFDSDSITYQPNKGLCTTNWLSKKTKDRVYTYCMVGLCFVLPFAIMIWIYICIFRAVQRTSAMARHNSVTPDTDIALTQQMLTPSQTNRRRSSLVSLTLMQIGSITRRQSSTSSRNSFHREDWRAAKTGLIVMSTFTLCWLPLFIVITLEASLEPSHEDSPIPKSLQVASVWLSLLVCALNPMVYVFRTKAFKHELLTLIGRPPQDHSHLYRDTNGTPTNSCNGRISKTPSAATFSRIISPRPSAISTTDIEEAKTSLANTLNMRDLSGNDKDQPLTMVAKVRASVAL